MAVFSCELSFFFSRSRVLILAVFFILNDLLSLCSSFFGSEKISCFVPFYYLMLGNDESGKTVWFLVCLFVVPALACVLLAPFCIKKVKKCWG